MGPNPSFAAAIASTPDPQPRSASGPAAGTQPGTVVTLRGRGMPQIGPGRRGDQQVVLNVVVPRKLSGRQRELLEELRDSLTPENLEEHADESLLSKVKRALR